MIFVKASLILAVVSFAAIFGAQSAEAATRGPKITSKVYFDIKHGDKSMGRSASPSLSRRCRFKSRSDEFNSRVGAFRWRTLCWVHVCVSRLNRRCPIYRPYPKLRRTSALWPLASRKMVPSSTMGTKAPNSIASSRTSCT